MSVYTLVYVSFATRDMSDDELKSILAASRKNNSELDITGMLLFRDGYFIQALEGEKEKVESLFEKISRDERHSNILRVYQETASKRAFDDWAMGFNKIENKDLADLDGFTDFMEKPQSIFFQEEPNRVRTLLNTFKNRSYF